VSHLKRGVQHHPATPLEQQPRRGRKPKAARGGGTRGPAKYPCVTTQLVLVVDGQAQGPASDVRVQAVSGGRCYLVGFGPVGTLDVYIS
jgi:hypothetical protein